MRTSCTNRKIQIHIPFPNSFLILLLLKKKNRVTTLKPPKSLVLNPSSLIPKVSIDSLCFRDWKCQFHKRHINTSRGGVSGNWRVLSFLQESTTTQLKLIDATRKSAWHLQISLYFTRARICTFNGNSTHFKSNQFDFVKKKKYFKHNSLQVGF